MAEVGTATVVVNADTKGAEKALRHLRRQFEGRVSWPEAFVFASALGFVSFLIEKVF